MASPRLQAKPNKQVRFFQTCAHLSYEPEGREFESLRARHFKLASFSKTSKSTHWLVSNLRFEDWAEQMPGGFIGLNGTQRPSLVAKRQEGCPPQPCMGL